MRYIPWMLSALAVFGAILNIQKEMFGFVVWTVANIGWVTYILLYKQRGMYGQIPLWIVFTALNIWGIIAWR